MRFAKLTFLIAGIYGILIIAPMYFLESQINRNSPAPISHPEQFYGFVGVTLAWQVLFVMIGLNPGRLRLAMIPAILEKLAFAIAVYVLFGLGRIQAVHLVFASIDMVLAVLFMVSFLKTREMSGK